MINIREHAKSSRICSTTLFAFIALLVVLQAATAVAAPQAHPGRTLFNANCASCHGQNGTPTAVGKSLNAPDLSTKAVQSQTAADLQQIIANGKGNMPPFNGRLSDAQINSLVGYIRALSGQRK